MYTNKKLIYITAATFEREITLNIVVVFNHAQGDENSIIIDCIYNQWYYVRALALVLLITREFSKLKNKIVECVA